MKGRRMDDAENEIQSEISWKTIAEKLNNYDIDMELIIHAFDKRIDEFINF